MISNPEDNQSKISDSAVDKKERKEIIEVNFNWNLSGFPEPRKTEDINFSWGKEELKKEESKTLMEDNDGKKELAYNNEGAKPGTANPMDELNRFFSFDKANEDFQKLLDKQHDRIKDFSQLPTHEPMTPNLSILDDLALEAPFNAIKTSIQNDEIDISEEDGIETFDEIQAKFEDKDEEKSDELDAGLVEEVKQEIEEGPEPEVIWISNGENDEDDVYDGDDNNDIEDVKESKTQDIDTWQVTDNQIETIEKSENQSLDKTVEGVELDAQVETLAQADTASGVEGDNKVGAAEEAEVSGPDQAPQQNILENPDGESNINIKEPLWFEVGDEEKPKKEGKIGRVILIIIILVLIAEATILGIQLSFPGSKAADKAAGINSAISGALINTKDKVAGIFGGAKKDDENNPAEETMNDGIDDKGDLPKDQEQPKDTAVEPDKQPAEDKSAILSSIAGLNRNIATVRINDSLMWNEGKTYGLPGITKSAPIENNHWYTDEQGVHFYYDKEIIATLVKFDSQWVDYVNGGSNDVIALTKEGSQARKNAETFSKVGKVKQTFDTLEIGEIRQEGDYFYTWTYEEINEVQGNKTTIKKYNWIYQLQPVNKEMKIVNYYKY